MIVKGHGLLREGRGHDVSGRYVGNTDWGGYGFCACGARSPLLETTAARKRWHNTHKATVIEKAK
jgi:hypothetical protein